MKLSEKRLNSMTARRTLNTFNESLTTLLMEKSFEKINVSDICSVAMIPRATFYNYYEDKYDLLNYYFHTYMGEVQFSLPEEGISFKEYMMSILLKLLQYIRKSQDRYMLIYSNNKDGYFIPAMKKSMEHKMEELLSNMDESTRKLPMELETELVANSIITIATWWMYHNEEYSTEEVLGFLEDTLA